VSAASPHSGLARLLEVVSRLREPGGCPWDREQTLQSLKRYVIEESYELLDAVDANDPERHKEELGDVLLQVALQARIRQEEGRFTFDDVAGALADKLIRRHPHVFGGAKAETSAEVLKHWETIKAGEKEGGRPLLAGIPRHLPALQKAERIQARAARVGFDWPDAQRVLDKIAEEAAELRESVAQKAPENVREELGDLLFSIVNLSRFLQVHPEEALDEANAKFMSRFARMEERVKEQNRALKDCSPTELDMLWNEAKREEISGR
jgi:MazG family protein